MSSLQQDYYRLTLQGNLRDTLLKMGLTGAREVSQQNQTMNLRKVAAPRHSSRLSPRRSSYRTTPLLNRRLSLLLSCITDVLY